MTVADYATSDVWGGLPNWPGRFPVYGLPGCLHKDGGETETGSYRDLPFRLFVHTRNNAPCNGLRVRLETRYR